MKHRLLLTLMCSILAGPVIAKNPKMTEGVCARITGSWYGQFTLYDPRDCHIYNGCTHQLSIHVKHINGEMYQADAKPQVGRPGSYTIQCKDGVMTAPSRPNSTIEFDCPDATICAVKYNDDKLRASLLGAGID